MSRAGLSVLRRQDPTLQTPVDAILIRDENAAPPLRELLVGNEGWAYVQCPYYWVKGPRFTPWPQVGGAGGFRFLGHVLWFEQSLLTNQ
jgi:hypothetical protein